MDTDEQAFRKQVGARLRLAREHRGLSLRDVAKHLDLAFQTVQSWEKGVNPIDTRRLHQLSRLYETPLAALLIDRLNKDEIMGLVSAALEPGETPPRKRQASGA